MTAVDPIVVEVTEAPITVTVASTGLVLSVASGTVGVAGPKGDTGATGPAGATGAQGPAGQGVPVGGTTGQVLAKKSATNYDTEWVAQTGGGGSGDVVGPSSSVDGRAALFDGTTGKLLKQSTAAPVLEGDARLTDSRTPTGTAGGDLTGTYPNPTVASGAITSAKIADGTIVDGDISASAAIAQSKVSGLTTDLAARVPTTRTINGYDLSADRTLTAADVGAAATSHVHSGADITSGTVGTARLGTGTASSSTFLRGDGTWATPSDESMLPVAANDYWLIPSQRGVTNYVANSPSSNASNSNGVAIFVPFYVGKSIGVDALALECTTANAGASAVLRLALFADSSGRPGTLTVDAGTQSINATGLKTHTFSAVTLTRGWYWAAMVAQGLDTAGTNPAFQFGGPVNLNGNSTVPPGGNFNRLRVLSVPGAFASNPTVQLSSSNTANAPLIWMRISTP